MVDEIEDNADGGAGEPEPAEAALHRRRFSYIWLIPIVAALVALYLGYHTLSQRGPLISIAWKNAEGLIAGQTQIKYKAVQMGTVESIELSKDFGHIEVKARMNATAEERLTKDARFWVVRPRLSPSNVSGLDTLVTGAYIEFDPGSPGGKEQREFTGLEDPPGIRSDEPGRIFTLRAKRVGSLGRGSPVFFRDIVVGEVLSYEPPKIDGDIVLHAFIRSPYDSYVHAGSRFWNASGARVNIGATGIDVELKSVQALLSGGVAFDTPREVRDTQPAQENTSFDLYEDVEAAAAATSPERVTFLIHFPGSVRGLAVGAPVEIQGQRVGSVTDLRLEYDKETNDFHVPVRIAVEPSRLNVSSKPSPEELRTSLDAMIARGLRAQLRSANILTGQLYVALDFVPDAKPAQLAMEGDEMVLPAEPGGSDNVMQSVSGFAGKLDRFPLDQIGENLNGALASVNKLAGGPEMQKAVKALSAALEQARALIAKADKGATPLLDRMPKIADDLQSAVAGANQAVAGLADSYGGNSAFHRDLTRLMDQLNDTARSIRLLADLLERHPEALIRGRTGDAK